jgi:hypothetical protein
VAAGAVKGRGARLKSLVLVLASTTIALLVGVWVTAYLTVWPPAMSTVGDGIVIYDPEIGLVSRPSAHTRHIYPERRALRHRHGRRFLHLGLWAGKPGFLCRQARA